MRYDAWAHGRMRWLVVGPLLVAVALLSALALASVDLLSAVRAYVGGESQWSKGQKDAIYHLERYIATHEPIDYRRFEEALAIPLGDRRARLALEQDTPDLEQARVGFLAGGNHVDDIDGMVKLFLRFRRVSFMAAAIDIWAEADSHIDHLAVLGRRVHERVRAGDTGSLQLRVLTAELPALNQRLTDLEVRFSTTLGEASRTVHQLVLFITVVLASGLMLGASWATWALMREQARVAQDLRDSNERWSLAADAAGLGLFDWDLRSDQARVDARGAALYGLPPQPAEMKAAELNESRVHPDDLARFRSAMTQAIAGPGATTVRYRVRPEGEGSERHLEVIARVRTHEGHQGMRMVGTLRDVTAEVHATQLRLDKEAADRTSRAKNEFFSRVSHELRTPLNAVLGFSELLHSDTLHPLTDAQQQRVQRVIDAGRQLLGLIDNILHLSDLDEQATPPPLGPVPLLPLVHDTVAHLQSLAERQQVRVTTESPEAASVHAEPRRLAQVLHHLLTNAIRYNRPGGEVTLRWERRGDEVRIDVRDTGPGLRPDQVAQLFQPFNRLGAEFSKVPGAGLGLVIVQQLLKRLNGRIEVSSVEGEGTCMQVHLAAADDQPVVVAAAPAAR